MTPERWLQFDRVWHAVLERPDEERATAVAELCGGDEALRHDVESMLTHLARASAVGFGGVAAWVMLGRESLIGRHLGPYAVHALLGTGGMGEVYRAHDATLGRDVAIKILPEPSLADSARLGRFDREARLLASLNHPNIGAIYGVHESGDVRALILELVEGGTLAERILHRARSAGPRRGLPIGDVATIASQIIEALEAAHERGIIHRDLKPANIKITPGGRVKVLDFGLARAVSDVENAPDLTARPAATISQTDNSVLLGTAAYMSPEQARGLIVDKRTDIWAFGCVLFEMLTGAPAFGGTSTSEVLDRVISAEPDWTALPHDTPAAMRVCLRRCLRKDLRERIHDVGDVRLALDGAFDLPAVDGHRAGRFSARAASAGWAAAALMAVIALIAATVSLRRAQPLSPPPAANMSPPVLVKPKAGGGGTGTARTIQEAIDMAARGATVSVLPGTYTEALTIRRGLTLEATGERSGVAVLAPDGTPDSVIEIATTDPVIIRGLTVHAPGIHAIRGTGSVDLTLERSTILAVNPPSGQRALITVSNDASATRARARLVVRQSTIDGAIASLPRGVPRPQSHAVKVVGDVDGVIEGNMVRRTGAICLVVDTRPDFGGHTNVDILNNDIDECHPFGRVGAIKVGSPAVGLLSPKQPVTATGVVNIIGNRIRNSSEDCLNSAIAYDVYTGRIERNRILDFVQPCAVANPRNMPSAIWLGLRVTGIPVPAVTPTVRFNDIQGNAHAGLRVAPNQTLATDVSCNYWGSARGPSGVGPGDGDAIRVEQGGTAPRFTPFATAPIARTTTGC